MLPDTPARRPLLVLGLVLLAAAAVGGCSLVFERPSVRVARVAVPSLSLTGGTLEVLLEVDNPNGYDLETRSFRYALAFPEPGTAAGDTTWIPLVEEHSRDTVRIPARDTVTFPVRVPFDLTTLGTAAGRLLREGELGYRFNGALRLQTPVGGVDVPFDERGTFRP